MSGGLPLCLTYPTSLAKLQIIMQIVCDEGRINLSCWREGFAVPGLWGRGSLPKFTQDYNVKTNRCLTVMLWMALLWLNASAFCIEWVVSLRIHPWKKQNKCFILERTKGETLLSFHLMLIQHLKLPHSLSRTCCLMCEDDVSRFPWPQAPCSLRSFKERSEYHSSPLQMKALAEILRFNTTNQMLHHCVPVSLVFRWPAVLWAHTSHLGIHGGCGSPRLGFADFLPRWWERLRCWVLNRALVGSIFLPAAPNCDWGRAQPFLLACAGCSSDALRLWSLFLLVCPNPIPKVDTDQWSCRADSRLPWFCCWSWMAPWPPPACTWCFVSCQNTPCKCKRWGKLLVWKSPLELHPHSGSI